MANLQSQPSLASTLPTNLPVTFMKEITRDFSVELELGRSVFGTVYKVRVDPNIYISDSYIQNRFTDRD